MAALTFGQVAEMLAGSLAAGRASTSRRASETWEHLSSASWASLFGCWRWTPVFLAVWERRRQRHRQKLDCENLVREKKGRVKCAAPLRESAVEVGRSTGAACAGRDSETLGLTEKRPWGWWETWMKRIATSQLWRCLLHDPLRWLPHRLLNTAATGPFTAMLTSPPTKSTSSRTVQACRKLRRASSQRRCAGGPNRPRASRARQQEVFAGDHGQPVL